MKERIKNENGQALLEFLMTSTFSFGFILLFYKISVNITNGYLVHYATFMASRTYLVYDTNSNTPDGSDTQSLVQARAVFNSYNIAAIPGFNGNLSANAPSGAHVKAYTGVHVSYQQSFSFSNILGGKDPMTFLSESFLGKEPTRAECLSRVCAAMGTLGASCSQHVTHYDNGC